MYARRSEEQKKDRKYSGAEIQYRHQASRFNLIAGAGYVQIDGDETFILDVIFDPSLSFSESAPLDTKHTNLYLYGYLNFLKKVTFTLGISGDFVSSDQSDVYDKTQVNPKFGITWNLVPDTTLRAAAFRVLKRTLVTNQTLEPTQVAGFNQFYDEFDSTDYWVYGVALDQKFTKNLYGGWAKSCATAAWGQRCTPA